MRFRVVEEHRSELSAARLCQLMDVSTRGLRANRNRPASRRQQFDLVTLAHIKVQSRLSLGSYALHSRVLHRNVLRVTGRASLTISKILAWILGTAMWGAPSLQIALQDPAQ